MCDIVYWANFYSKNSITLHPSSFCLFLTDYLQQSKLNIMNILDCGCGNGRDSYYLSNEYTVTGIDNCKIIPQESDNCRFVSGDFCNYPKDDYDLIYSRFTFHSITNEQQQQFLNSITKPDTILCIETRSDKGVNDYRYHGDAHFRNFTNLEYFKQLLHDNNFECLYVTEDNNLAVYKDENPYCIRVICRKK